MIDKIKKYLIENIAYVLVFSFAGIYLIIQEGSSYTFNYISILLGLFIPVFVVINCYGLIKSLVLKENITYKELLVCLTLIIFTIIIYIFGLNESQRIIMGLITGVLSIVILVIMLFITNKKK
jgi:hypothetical protein